MIITATNGIIYEVRFAAEENFEIERDDTSTGLRKVFVFQDIAIGPVESKRKETIFYSFDITPTGERVFADRHSFKDFDSEFDAFQISEVWTILKNGILNDFIRKVELTEIASREE